MRKLIFIALFIASCLAANAQQKITTSSVEFKIKNFGVTVDGSLSGLETSLNFAPSNLSKSYIKASVKVNTIKTGIGARDTHLKSDDYFDADKYPNITLESTKFSKLGDNKYSGFFKLTIKNVTKEVSFPFTYTPTKTGGTFSGTFTLNRLDYGVGESSLTLGDIVTVNITVTIGA